jgi:eukaryotic-like serine/threonine-protein kinase
MSDLRGKQFGPYVVEQLAGEGGMGQVYRARDSRLGRSVAIKVLRDRASGRFRREANAIAALNHPHICTLYDIGPDYLVMEYIEGKPLNGPLGLRTALVYAAQILEALEAAHGRGIVHRDLKPSNVMITSSGVKLLDFGLAKACAAPGDQETTATVAVTAEHTVLGTPQYMAPEQIEGRPLDHRADIFAFGCVLYEMIAGKPAFQGRSSQTVMGAVLDCESRSFVELQAPAPVKEIVAECLRRDPDARWQSAHDIRMALGMTVRGENVPATTGAWRRAGAWSFAGALVGAVAALAFVLLRPVSRVAEESRALTILAPEGTNSIDNASISPDGRTLAMVAGGRLWIRPLASAVAKPVEESTEALKPFWAPDSDAVAFFAEGKLKRVAIAGGLPRTLAPAPEGNGGVWSKAGFIVYAPTENSCLYRIPAEGGPSMPLTTVGRDQVGHSNPALLPDGRLLYAAFGTADATGIYGADIPPQGRIVRSEMLLKGAAVLACSPTNVRDTCMLLYVLDRVYAQPFEFAKMRLRGGAVGLRVPGQSSPVYAFSASYNGIGVIGHSDEEPTAVIALDRYGRTERVIAPPATQYNLGLSPDGTELAVARSGESLDLWLYHLERGTVRRVVSNPAADGVPVWSPDGSRLAFASWRDGRTNLYVKEAHGSSPETRLLSSDADKYPTDWSRDGKYLMYETLSNDTGWDLWVMRADASASGAAPEPYLHTEWNERDGGFSPDGRWVVYTSTESGRSEVYVQSFPAGRGKWQISNGGGDKPVWRKDGRELFFLSPDGYMMVANTSAGATFSSGEPKRLFAASVAYLKLGAQFAVDPSGQRFYVNSTASPRRDAVTVVLSWNPNAN